MPETRIDCNFDICNCELCLWMLCLVSGKLETSFTDSRSNYVRTGKKSLMDVHLIEYSITEMKYEFF